jgi:hypothetical protein
MKSDAAGTIYRGGLGSELRPSDILKRDYSLKKRGNRSGSSYSPPNRDTMGIKAKSNQANSVIVLRKATKL